ncbi:nitrate- and nitrite sensing domain-containing protein [Micromonospora sp. CPCC 206060]|uniref:nitrate- and nitrite sensing domain-containing protein n=1 Tax=Micromonospora sp. CPCC 206060 TaxID=3122406 RepID=UPI002FEF941E
MKTGNWPIRSKIVALVVMPIAALLVLWIFSTTLVVGPALKLLAAQTLFEEVGRPGEKLVAELQRERRLSVVYLASRADLPALRAQRVRTDEAIVDFRRRVADEDLRDAADDLLEGRLDQLITGLEALPAGRAAIDQQSMDRAGALGLYSGIVATAFGAFSVTATLPDEGLNRQVRALTGLGQARELLGQADALLAGAITGGGYAPGEHAQLIQIIGSQEFLTASAVAELPAASRAAYQRLVEAEAFVQLRAMQEALVGADGRGVPVVDVPVWQASYDTVQQRLREFELGEAQGVADRTMPVAVGILARLGATGLLGLVAVVGSVVVALRVGRSLVHRLTSLRTVAFELAEQRLPGVVARLRQGGEVDIAREAPPLEYGSDEIGQVAQAFSAVQRTAVRSAVDEAALRQGLNEVFLNIARRSQTLLHRQLALLDRMEHRVEDPDELADLFQVDHLATRMRRHAEDLVILAGAAPGRGWRNPVPMIDVIRGAVSEIEDYARVDVAAVQDAATAGRAVGDVIHLLAELIENATVFSPPETQVRVAGELVPNGYAIEITDRGLGMSAEALAGANQRLAEPPDFDPANTARLGLFVVARLGARHGVKVQLRPSAYGGITAVVLIPTGLIVRTPDAGEPAGAGPTVVGGAQVARIGPTGRPVSRLGRLSTVPRLRPGRSGGAGRGRGTATPLRPAPVETGVDGGPSALPADPPIGPDGLPRRIRQRSMSPKLLAPVDPAPSRKPATRTPEQTRAAMSALQAGTARGRQDSGAFAQTGPGRADGPDGSGGADRTAGSGRADRTGPTAVSGGAGSGPPRGGATPMDQPTAELPRVTPVTDRGSTDSGRDA